MVISCGSEPNDTLKLTRKIAEQLINYKNESLFTLRCLYRRYQSLDIG